MAIEDKKLSEVEVDILGGEHLLLNAEYKIVKLKLAANLKFILKTGKYF